MEIVGSQLFTSLLAAKTADQDLFRVQRPVLFNSFKAGGNGLQIGLRSLRSTIQLLAFVTQNQAFRSDNPDFVLLYRNSI